MAAHLTQDVRGLLGRVERRPGRVVLLTGAGISAESGIPTFRGKEGYWTVGSREYHPQELATRSAFLSMPETVWEWYLYRRTVCLGASPNAAHHAVVELERRLGDRFLLVTQNVDGLRLRAGSSPGRTYEIHGNVDFMRCLDECSPPVPVPRQLGPKKRGEPLAQDEARLLRCGRCGGWARPHVLWFDECYDEPPFRFTSSLSAADRAALLVIVGTSASTNLPVKMAHRAAQAGAVLLT